jgi:KipI family sensor histidine kinase inhibitor
MAAFRIVAAGDAALVIELPERIDPAVNAWCVALARALARALGTAIRDVVIGYSSVTIYLDPLRTDPKWLEGEIDAIASELEIEDVPDGPLVDVPVCYGGALGPDLQDVANFAGCSAEEVIGLHAGRDYRVYLVGFVPGFAYMAEVDGRIAAPRRVSPRTAVPAGSVAIAGGQTGIYPSITPGGWNVIGRTPVKPYDPDRAEPFLFRPGDRVRFHRIGEDEYHARLAQ